MQPSKYEVQFAFALFCKVRLRQDSSREPYTWTVMEHRAYFHPDGTIGKEYRLETVTRDDHARPHKCVNFSPEKELILVEMPRA